MGEVKLVDITLAVILVPIIIVALPFVWVGFQVSKAYSKVRLHQFYK